SDHITDQIKGLLHQCGGPNAILSLDVFDTLLLRDDQSELRRFYDIGAEMAEIVAQMTTRPCTAQDAFAARMLGTLASYRAGPKVQGCREGALDDIHRVASLMLMQSPAATDRFIAAELRYERAVLTPFAPLIALMAEHKARGGRVLLLSDMYMRAPHIAELLHGHGITADQYDVLLSSADTKISKASGLIFKEAEGRLGAQPEQFVHVGDAPIGDVQKPKQNGWRSVHLPIPNQTLAARADDHARMVQHVTTAYGFTLPYPAPPQPVYWPEAAE
ncbi:MAG: HAD family hydrolase, partial [Pseudomonadota bacterium]